MNFKLLTILIFNFSLLICQAGNNLSWEKKDAEVNASLEKMHGFLKTHNFKEFMGKYWVRNPFQKEVEGNKQTKSLFFELMNKNKEVKKVFLESLKTYQRSTKAYTKSGTIAIILGEELMLMVKDKGRWKLTYDYNK